MRGVIQDILKASMACLTHSYTKKLQTIDAKKERKRNLNPTLFIGNDEGLKQSITLRINFVKIKKRTCSNDRL